MNSRVTINDIAKIAGVSKTAVSFAYNNPAKLSEATRERILEVAANLGYVRNAAARSMRTNTTGALGLLLPQNIDVALKNPYYSLLIQGIGEVCQEQGYALLLVPPFEESTLKAIPTAAVDGFIISGLEKERSEVVEIASKHIPLVVIDPQASLEVPTVEIQDDEAIAQLVTRVLEQGHQRFGIAAIETKLGKSYKNWHGVMGQRMEKIVAAFASHAVTLDENNLAVYQAPSTYEGGIKAFHELQRAINPTVIIAFSDVIARGAIRAAQDSGLLVPRDLSVTGYDGIPDYGYSSPVLTTIRQPIAEKGRIAADILVKLIQDSATGRGTEDKPTHHVLNAVFVPQATLGGIPR
ncbi:HTH-type transcriptional repressor CytR [Mobiluncus mulieris]|nr:HTH-type transcriptional repressor CytR [Mobiluncus mulieris]